MGVILVTLVVATLVLTEVAMVFMLKRSVETRLDNAKAAINTFMTAKAEGETSPFADLVDEVGKVLAARMATSTMAAIRGSLGGASKAETQETIDSIPALGMINAVNPKLARKLGKNPLAMAGLQGLLNKISSPGPGNVVSSVSGNGHDNQSSFKLG